MTISIAAIIIGIDGWQEYTLPLVESIRQHEPGCDVIIVDNFSARNYPHTEAKAIMIRPTKRLCYSAAINRAHDVLCEDYEGDVRVASDHYDWYIVLSNDVLCTGPFAHILEGYGDDNLVGPLLKNIDIETVGNVPYLEGWTVFVPRYIWDTIGGWDEGMRISSYEDVEYSHRARVNGFGLIEDTDLPFKHLDQKQRFTLVPDYWSSEWHNRERFKQKYGRALGL